MVNCKPYSLSLEDGKQSTRVIEKRWLRAFDLSGYALAGLRYVFMRVSMSDGWKISEDFGSRAQA